MKKIIASTFFVLTCFFSSKMLAQNNTLLTINVYESTDKGYNRIIVIENDKKIEETELSPFYYKDLESHQIAANKTILKYRDMGYKIVSEIRGTVGGTGYIVPVMITTYRLEK